MKNEEAVELGYDLTVEHPEIVRHYRKGKSISEIANSIRDNGFRRYSRAVLESAVRYSLRGNNRKDLGETFIGLMTPEEFEEITRDGKVKDTPWKDYELEHLIRLKELGFTNPSTMANLLNLACHRGREVRDASDIEEKLENS